MWLGNALPLLSISCCACRAFGSRPNAASVCPPKSIVESNFCLLQLKGGIICHRSVTQRGVVDAAHTDDVPQLLAKRREAVANPMWYRRAARLSGRVGRKSHLSSGTAHTKSAVKRWSTLLYCTNSSINIA